MNQEAPPRGESGQRKEKAKSRGVSTVNVRRIGAPPQMETKTNKCYSRKRPLPWGEGGKGGRGGVAACAAVGAGCTGGGCGG